MKLKTTVDSIGKFVWKRETLISILIGLAIFVAFVSMARIPNMSANAEMSTANSVSSLQNIYDNPINAPYKLISYVTTKLSPSVVMLRAVSFAIFGLTSVALFFALQYWHTTRAAILATLAFSTNSIVLAVSRLGTPLALMFSWFIFSSMLLWQVHSKSNKIIPIAVLIGLGILLYTPGALWFFIVMIIVYLNKVKRLFKDVKIKAVVFGGIVSTLLVAPLVLSFIGDISTFKEWLLLPDHLILGEVPRSILRVPSAFIYRMPEAPLINIARLPVFDIASGMIFLVGLNAYRKKLKLDRTRIFIGVAVVSIIIGALGQTITAVVLLLPFAFCIMAAGIEFLIDEWRVVFPRNPIAKGFGSILLTIAVLFGAQYQLTRYFIVWPQTPETKSVYNESRIIKDTAPADTI